MTLLKKLALAALLLAPAHAWAECAWVLCGADPAIRPAPGQPWKPAPGEAFVWRVKAAFETRRGCEKNRRHVVFPDGAVAHTAWAERRTVTQE